MNPQFKPVKKYSAIPLYGHPYIYNEQFCLSWQKADIFSKVKSPNMDTS